MLALVENMLGLKFGDLPSFRKSFRKLTNFIRFVVVSSITFTTDLVLLWLLADVFGINYIISAIFAFILPTTCHYLVSRTWIFKKTKRDPVAGYIYFVAIAIADLILIVVLLSLCVEVFHFHYMWSRIFVGLAVGVWNYWMNSKFNFAV